MNVKQWRNRDMKRVEIFNFCQERMVKRNPKENGTYLTIRVGLIGIYKMINIWENNEWQIKIADASEVVETVNSVNFIPFSPIN